MQTPPAHATAATPVAVEHPYDVVAHAAEDVDISLENAALLAASAGETTDDDSLLDDSGAEATQGIPNVRMLRSVSPQLSQWLHAQRAAVLRGESQFSQRTMNVILNATEPTSLNRQASTDSAPVTLRFIQAPPSSLTGVRPRIDLSIDTSVRQAAESLALTTTGDGAHGASSRVSSPGSSSSSSEEEREETSMFDDFRSLFRRAHHSLPFIALFVVYFASQHAVAITTFVIGSVAIAGLDQRLRTQIALKESANRLHLWGIVAMCIVDTVIISMLDGDVNPVRHLMRKIETTDGAVILEVLWLVLVNDFIVRLWSLALKAAVAAVNSETIFCGRRRRVSVSGVAHDLEDDAESGRRRKSTYSSASFYRRKRKLYGIIELTSIFIRSLLAGVPWCTYYQLCSSKFVADLFTFVYIFGKGLVLGTQGRQLFRLVLSFVTLGLEHATYVTREELVENGCPDCSICYESMHVPVKLTCSHMFCEECVMEWFDRERSCPLCRAAISEPSMRSSGEVKPQYLDGSTSLFPQLF